MKALRIGSLSHVALNVTDIEKSTRFYTEILGLRQIFATELPAGLGFSAGFVTSTGDGFELLQLAGPDGAPNAVDTTTQCSRMVFSIADIEEAKGVLAGNKISIVNEMEFEGIQMLFIQDPDGRIIELAEFPDGVSSLAQMHQKSK